MTAISTHEKTFAFALETTQGQPPGFATSTPRGTAAGWVSAEGSTAHRLYFLEGDPYWIKADHIVDPTLVDSALQSYAPIQGVQNADGGTLVLAFQGTGAETAASSQVAESGYMSFLEVLFGGLFRSNSTAVAAGPTSGTDYTVDDAANIEAGCLIAVEDADETGRLSSQRVLTKSTNDLTTDELPDFSIAEDDKVHAIATFFFNADAFTCGDADYQTMALCYVVGGKVWTAVGAKPQLDSIVWARNEVPKVNVSLYSAKAFPPGGSSFSEPAWSGSVVGTPGAAVGRNCVLRISDNGTDTYTCFDAYSAEFIPGIAIVPNDGVTECTENMEGRSGYHMEPGDCLLTVSVLAADGWQDDFDNIQDLEVTFEQQLEAGKFTCCKLPLCAMVVGPAPGEEGGTLRQTLVFKARESSDVTNASYPEMAKSRALVGMG